MIGDIAARIIRLKVDTLEAREKELSVLFLLENYMDKVVGPAEKIL